MSDKPDDIEMLSQPFLTDEGAVNPACMNELEAAIDGMDKTYKRLSRNEEWSRKAYTFRKDIIANFAHWAVRLSPYDVPEDLGKVLGYLGACLKTYFPWDSNDMLQLSLCEINRALYEILYEQRVTAFDAWNHCKVGDTPEIQFSCQFDGPLDPDRDFVDLDALLHEVCIGIRLERRDFDRFNAEFEAEQRERDAE